MVGRYPPIQGFLRRWGKPVADLCVYITHGMSEVPMKVPTEERELYPERIEFIAFCKAPYIGAHDGEDTVSAVLQMLAIDPFLSGRFFGPLQTASFDEPPCVGTEMNGFFFAVPFGVDMKTLCSCTPQADLVVSVMPITPPERAYAVQHGSERLVELFEKKNVPNLFDMSRESAI